MIVNEKRREVLNHADILGRMYLKAESDFRFAALEMAQYRRDNGGEIPDWTLGRFYEINTRIRSILEAIKILREKLSDPFFGMEAPSHWPPNKDDIV